jgi:hypothetical protein
LLRNDELFLPWRLDPEESLSEDSSNEEKPSKFSTSLRKGIKSIQSFGRDASMPCAIAALIRDAAQAAVEVAVEKMQAKVVKADGTEEEYGHDDDQDYSQVVDFARVAKAAEAAMETSFANRSFRAGEDQCLVPGEAVVRIEKAPDNSRRIFAGIDIISSVDDVWNLRFSYLECTVRANDHLSFIVLFLLTQPCRPFSYSSGSYRL